MSTVMHRLLGRTASGRAVLVALAFAGLAGPTPAQQELPTVQGYYTANAPGVLSGLENAYDGNHDPHGKHFVDVELPFVDPQFQLASADAFLETKTFPSHFGQGPGGQVTHEREVLKILLQQRAGLLLDGKVGEAKFQGSISSRWAFQVVSSSLPPGEVVEARISGTAWIQGFDWHVAVNGPGSAEAQVRIAVRNRLAPEKGGLSRSRTVASSTLWSSSVRHTYDWSVGAGIGVDGGDGLEVPFGVNAGRSFSNETRLVPKQALPFSLPALLQVGQFYEVEITLAGAVQNRGLKSHWSNIEFGDTSPFDTSRSSAAARSIPPDDPSFLGDAFAFFMPDLPDLQIGKIPSGDASFNFPKLVGLFDGKHINVSNTFAIEPVGHFDKLSAVFQKLGKSPADLPAMLAGSAGAQGAAAPATGRAPPAEDGGLWLQELSIELGGD